MSAPTGYTEDDMLPISGLADVVFCPRRAALHHLEGAWEDNLWTAEGSLVHERAHEGPRREVRGDVVWSGVSACAPSGSALRGSVM